MCKYHIPKLIMYSFFSYSFYSSFIHASCFIIIYINGIVKQTMLTFSLTHTHSLSSFFLSRFGSFFFLIFFLNIYFFLFLSFILHNQKRLLSLILICLGFQNINSSLFQLILIRSLATKRRGLDSKILISRKVTSTICFTPNICKTVRRSCSFLHKCRRNVIPIT